MFWSLYGYIFSCIDNITVISGDGDPPDTALKWWRSVYVKRHSSSCNTKIEASASSSVELSNIGDSSQPSDSSSSPSSTENSLVNHAARNCTQSATLPNLSKLHYTVLGLGDTNYTNFCNFGKNLDEKLKSLGAIR